MKIVLFPSAYYPSLGGVEELTNKIALQLVNCGHYVKIFTALMPNTKKKDIHAELDIYRFRFKLPARKVIDTLVFLFLFPVEMFRILLIVKRFKADIIHIQCASSNTLYAVVASKLLRVPLVLTSQGETRMDAGKIYKKSAFMRKILVYGLKQASYVTACSKATLDDLCKNYFDVSLKSKVVFNGIDSKEFGGDVQSIEDTYIFATGRLSSNKGFDLLIRAFQSLPDKYKDVSLFIGGSGEQEQELRELIADLKLGGRVRLLGRLNRMDTVKYMKNSLFVTMTSRYEPFGIVATEGLAAGKAVMVTKHGGPPEFINDREQGLVIDPFNDDLYVEKLVDMLESYEKYQQGNYEYVSNYFNWSIIVESYLDIYRLVGNK
jgi:glycogen synthase